MNINKLTPPERWEQIKKDTLAYLFTIYAPMVILGYFWTAGSAIALLVILVLLGGVVFAGSFFTKKGLKEKLSIFYDALRLGFPLIIAMIISKGSATFEKGIPDFMGIPFPFSWALVGLLLTITASYLLAPLSKAIDTWRKPENQPQRQAQMQQDRQDPNGQSKANPVQEYPVRKPRFAYKDVHGMEVLKNDLTKAVSNFKKEGGNGILLYGEPGNGKTFVAEALAGQLKVNFLEARTSEMTSKWIGDTTEKVKMIFDAAKLQAPCILFLDEIDSFLMDRGDSSMTQDARQSANTFLTSIADLNNAYAKHGVLVLAATNFVEKLDGAGIREGRFDRKIKVYSPDNEARKGIMMDGLAGYKPNAKIVGQVVARWEGFSVARMRGIAKTAKRFVKDENLSIDIELLERALREVQGRLGENISENALTLNELSFNKYQRLTLDTIINGIQTRHHVESRGGQMPKGVIFFGPPGTGKTTVAKALAREVGWSYLSTSGQALLQTPDEIDKSIRMASDIRPTIVFIDEAEGILGHRELNPHTKEITNKLLFAMDGEKPLHDVFFIAATNSNPGDIDPAIMRWGRFSEAMDFTPDAKALKGVILRFMDERKEYVIFEGDVDEMVSRMSDLDFSPADTIESLIKAVNKALSESEDKNGMVVVNLDGLP